MITKKALGKFTSISIFDDKYLLVERDGMYNLIDNNGDYVSKNWYSKIKKNYGGGIDFIEEENKPTIQLRSVALISTYHSVKSAININPRLSQHIDMRCVDVVTPFILHVNRTSKKVTIIAKVTIFGKVYKLSDTGELYDENDNHYDLPEFFISYTDINRLVDIADEFNYAYSNEYNSANKEEYDTLGAIRKNHITMWIFGFSTNHIMFNTATKNIVGHTTTDAWGGDTIKVRILGELLPELYKDAMIDRLLLMGFNYALKADFYTKIYELADIDKLFKDIHSLIADKSQFKS